MKHIFERGSNPESPTLLLLHGTGGTERDLLPLAALIDPAAAVLSVRGNVLENGMPRFFRRLAEGVFDEKDLVFRTHELNDFLTWAVKEYGLNRDNVVAIGYSNGANIAGSLLFHIPNALRGVILHHPMVPRRGVPLPDLTNLPVFVGAGRNDPICSAAESKELQALLTEAGANVTMHWEDNGHRLTTTEMEAARDWYREHLMG